MADPSPPTASSETTKELWSKKASAEDISRRRYTSWMMHPLIDRKINRIISGSETLNWVDHVKARHIPQPLARGLSLGCGGGGLERHALYVGICRHFDAFDVAPGAIDIATAEAGKIGYGARVYYEARDINALQLPSRTYDVAFACQSAHHFENIEHIFRQVDHALTPDGLFILNEYVGPTRFQWTDIQLGLINDLLGVLPPAYRRLVHAPEVVRERVPRPTIAEMLAFDPSEAIRSSELVDAIRSRFEIVERIDFGGTLLHPLLQDIAGNFSPDSADDARVLDALWEIEQRLIAAKTIPSDFTFIVARRKSSPVRRMVQRARNLMGPASRQPTQQ